MRQPVAYEHGYDPGWWRVNALLGDRTMMPDPTRAYRAVALVLRA
jgi:hypothetical protein